MIQRQITHPSGTFAACSTCKKEPRHFMAIGSTSQESSAFSALSERHQLECVCEHRTGWRHSLADALHIWNQFGEALLPVIRTEGNVHSITAHRAMAVAALGSSGRVQSMYEPTHDKHTDSDADHDDVDGYEP